MSVSLICKQCGKKFISDIYKRKFCSEECRKKYRPSYERVCEYCGKQYTAHHYKGKYCSPQCGKKARNKITGSNDIKIDPKWLRRK